MDTFRMMLKEYEKVEKKETESKQKICYLPSNTLTYSFRKPSRTHSRVESFRKVIERFRDVQVKEVPEVVWENIDKNTAGRKEVSEALKKLGLERYLYAVLVKLQPKIDIDMYNNRILDDFDLLEKNFSGKTFFNSQFVLFKLLERHGVSVKRDCLKVPMENKEMEFHMLCKNLKCVGCALSKFGVCEECEDYEQWEWIRLLESGNMEGDRLTKKWKECHYKQGEGERYKREQRMALDKKVKETYIKHQRDRRIRLQKEYEDI